MFILQMPRKRVSSRQQINIEEIRDGVLILSGGEYRAVASVNSINFELRSEEEQDAVIENYQSFLNSLPCTLQILIRVKEIDINSYLKSFTPLIKSEAEEVYKNQAINYRKFVSGLVKSNKILTRRFYFVISCKSLGDDSLQAYDEQLRLNMDILSRGLSRLGINLKPLTSMEVLGLFYDFYCPSTSKLQPLNQKVIDMIGKSYI